MTLAIGFDFDHTLGVDHALERKALYAYAVELGRPADAVAAPRADALLDAFRTGRLSMEAMVARFGELAGAGADGMNAPRWREICYVLVDELVQPLDDARATLDALRARGIPLAILTNGWTPLQHKKIASALGAEMLDAIPLLVSDAIGAIKPDPRAFDALVAALGVAREHVWYVGDNARGDVAGALAAGLRAVWLDAEGQPYPSDIPPPTLRIGSLRELTALAQNTIAP